jgi:iron complex outermembrane receptor protein
MNRGVRVSVAIAVLLLPCRELWADEDDPSDVALYETESTRRPSALLQTPASISVVSAEEVRRAQPATSLDEALTLVPGVFAQSGRNFAQDSRVSIRGYGARAEFGVRGVKMLVDGVPTTLPDGQTELDSLDPIFVERIEVVRGPVSSLYGGGGGGLISVSTLEPSAEPKLVLRTLFGAHHLSRYSATLTGTRARTGYAIGLSRTRSSGYRAHARAEQTVLSTKLTRETEAGTQLRLGFSSVWAPEAQDAGGLNAAEVAMDRRAARTANVVRDAHEKLNQQRVSLSLRRPLGPGRELEATLYRVWRDFANALPIDRRVDFDRTVTGGSVLYRNASRRVRWMLGLDVDAQRDRRRNYENLAGARGALTLRQSETVRSVGPFAQAEVDLPLGFGVVVGLRYDWVEFVVGDRLVTLTNGDRSERLRFREPSPRLGLSWGRSSALQLYANLATAFRVPTTTELAPSDSAGGFASDIDPEKTLGFEIGAKGLIWERVFYDLVLFDLRIDDVAVEFDEGGPTLFRDAGKVRRRGAELAFSVLVHPGLSLRASYTYADYRYVDFDVVEGGIVTELDGRHEPNTPKHSVGAELRAEHPSGLYGTLSLRHFSDIEVDDANSAESQGATLSDLRVGWEIERGVATFEPFAGIRNWTRVRYDGSLRPNAFAGRYFEPAPETELYIGLQVSF